MRDRFRLRAAPFLSPARTEVYWGERLGRMRVPTPVPVLLAEEGPRGGRSVLVTRAVEGGIPLDRIQEAPSREVLSAAAGVVARLHREGLVHRDLYLNHLLLDPQGGIWVADLQRMMEPRFFFERWRVKDLAALLHSAPAWAGPATRLRFLLLYARALAGEEDGRDLRALARKVSRKQKRMAAHKPRWG